MAQHQLHCPHNDFPAKMAGNESKGGSSGEDDVETFQIVLGSWLKMGDHEETKTE
jgi:hypothetical protein